MRPATSGLLVIGVDPGPTTGILALGFPRHVGELTAVAETDPTAARRVVDALLDLGHHHGVRTVLAVESFVLGHRAVHSWAPEAGRITRELIGVLAERAHRRPGVEFVRRPAGLVKPWATTRRLDAAGLLRPTVGMPHARDAARHTLYAAVRDGGIPDPLSAPRRVIP